MYVIGVAVWTYFGNDDDCQKLNVGVRGVDCKRWKLSQTGLESYPVGGFNIFLLNFLVLLTSELISSAHH